MSSPFTPVEELEVFCRFCEKITSAQLDRSIAENGRTVDRGSTFEYLCGKCLKTFCYCGNDLLEQQKDDSENTVRKYSPKDHFLIGETVQHAKWKDKGKVVGKEKGSPPKILVNFEKHGLKRLIEDLN